MSDSYSSDTSPAEKPSVDLVASGRFPPLVESFLRGDNLDLLAPVRFLAPGGLPVDDCRATAPERQEIAVALATANREAGHPAAMRLADRLADPATRVVITGQQPGLFGGPLYTLSKAIAAQLWAEHLEAAGHPAVALFWVATEDHDFLEIARAAVLAPEGLTRVDLGDDPEPLKPVGRRRLGERVEAARATIEVAVPGERYADWWRQVGLRYKAEVGFGQAFTGLMTELLGERCPLLVDAMLPQLKRAERPWMRRLVEQRDEVGEAFADRDRAILDRGFELQVRPQPGTSPLFLELEGRRRRIEWREGDRFGLRGEDAYEASVADLLDTIDREPDRISPGVRARSAIQDAVFGTCLQVLGPGELAYLPQAAPLFDLLDIPPPLVALRPQVLVLDSRQRGHLEELGISLSTLVAPDFDLDAWLARPEDVDFVERASSEIEAILRRIGEAARALDDGLEGPLEKTRGQVHKALEIFAGRVQTAAARRDEVRRNRLTALREQCLPGGVLQERVVASAHFPGKYGADFIDAMFDQMELEPTNLRVVSP